jgi:hypothetical protein
MAGGIWRWRDDYDITFCADSDDCPRRHECLRHMTNELSDLLMRNGGAVSYAHLAEWFLGECSSMISISEDDDEI